MVLLAVHNYKNSIKMQYTKICYSMVAHLLNIYAIHQTKQRTHQRSNTSNKIIVWQYTHKASNTLHTTLSIKIEKFITHI